MDDAITVGDVEIRRVEELLLPTSVRWLLPDAPREAVERAYGWLRPHFVDGDGYLVQSVHTFVVRTPDLLTLVDTGVGNDKPRGGAIPAFNMLQTPFIEGLAAAGVTPEDVDFVVCTHIHSDHVGWNTRLVDGEWVPTFPNARYLCAEPEWEYWTSAAEQAEATLQLLEDSVYPVRDAGLLDVVPADHRISPELRLEPSHGHTPGHVSVRVDSGGATAVMIGDVMHHPVQCAMPAVRPALDRDELPARRAREALLERYADTGTLILGAHFNAPSAGRIVREGSAYRFAIEAGEEQTS